LCCRVSVWLLRDNGVCCFWNTDGSLPLHVSLLDRRNRGMDLWRGATSAKQGLASSPTGRDVDGLTYIVSVRPNRRLGSLEITLTRPSCAPTSCLTSTAFRSIICHKRARRLVSTRGLDGFHVIVACAARSADVGPSRMMDSRPAPAPARSEPQAQRRSDGC
jgi:hypothetical protein